MLLTQVVLVLGLAAAPDLKIAQGTFRFVGISTELREFIPEHVGHRLQRPGIKVVTSSDIQNILGMERQRELMGCSEGGCMTELIGALGADGLLVGEVARVGVQLQVNLKILSGRSGETIAAFALRVESENRLLGLLDEGADALGNQLIATRTPLTHRVVGAAFWVPAVVAVVGLASGGVTLVLAGARQTALLTAQAPPRSLSEANQLVKEGETLQALGLVGVGVGAAAAITAVIAFGLSPNSPISTSVAVGPDGAAVTLRGTFP